MAFPDLVLKPNGIFHAQIVGVPDSGDNDFDAGIDLVKLDGLTPGGAAAVDEWLNIEVVALGDSVSGASYVSRDGNTLKVNFTQGGADQALVIATFTHSMVR